METTNTELNLDMIHEIALKHIKKMQKGFFDGEWSIVEANNWSFWFCKGLDAIIQTVLPNESVWSLFSDIQYEFNGMLAIIEMEDDEDDNQKI